MSRYKRLPWTTPQALDEKKKKFTDVGTRAFEYWGAVLIGLCCDGQAGEGRCTCCGGLTYLLYCMALVVHRFPSVDFLVQIP